MSPNNLFIYKNGAIRQDYRQFKDTDKYIYELQKDNKFYTYINYEHPSLQSEFRQICFVRYSLPNGLNIWIEE